MEWDESQLEVIYTEPHARLIVEAGPGTGKTAVACGRIASLIDDWNLHPSKIWMLSFTRAAVHEFKDRIGSHLSKPEQASMVKISTLDSEVWHLRQGFDEQDVKKLLRSYDANIESVIGLLKERHEQLLDYLEDEIDHLVVDEAQDLVGVRGELVHELVNAVRPDCGITVFGDSAQAIYGFTTDDGKRDSAAETVVEMLDGDSGSEFDTITLQVIHRTSESSLRELFTSGRDTTLANDQSPADRLRSLVEKVRSLAHGHIERPSDAVIPGRDDLLVLYRTRAEAARDSSYLWKDGHPHKLRISGLEPRLHPWIARIFWDFLEDTIDRQVFTERWWERISDGMAGGWNESNTWEQLRSIAADGPHRIDLVRVRQVLGRSRPPDEFLVAESELPGPTLGTIHASKGRESDFVHLMIPKSWGGDLSGERDAVAEEGRVAYVGATRPRKELRVGDGGFILASGLESGRTFTFGNHRQKPRAQVHLGIRGDVSPIGIGGSALADEGLQEFLWVNSWNHRKVKALARPPSYTSFLFDEEKGVCLGALSDNVNRDLFTIAKRISSKRGLGPLRPGEEIRHIHLIGSASHVTDITNTDIQELPSPVRTSGMFLKPSIFAFTMVYFFRRRQRFSG